MKPTAPHPLLQQLLIAAWLILAASALAQNKPVKLDVDATDASRKILHARLRIPASRGPLTLLYPKWLQGEHAPTGPIADLVGLKMSAAGKPVTWQRDAEDMCAFHLDLTDPDTLKPDSTTHQRNELTHTPRISVTTNRTPFPAAAAPLPRL